MGHSNKNIKRKLILKYGAKCFIEELGLRSPEEIEADKKRYTGTKQLEIMDELTYHHIIERCKGGAATEENGAILRNINHRWFNRLSPERQAEINKLFQQYKQNYTYKINAITFSTDKCIDKQSIEVTPTEDVIIIPAYDTTEKDLQIYLEHKRKRNERVFKKFERFEKDYGR